MSRFIELTLSDGQNVTLNTNNFLKIFESDMMLGCKTCILFSNGYEKESIFVQQSYKEIKILLHILYEDCED